MVPRLDFFLSDFLTEAWNSFNLNQGSFTSKMHVFGNSEYNRASSSGEKFIYIFIIHIIMNEKVLLSKIWFLDWGMAFPIWWVSRIDQIFIEIFCSILENYEALIRVNLFNPNTHLYIRKSRVLLLKIHARWPKWD